MANKKITLPKGCRRIGETVIIDKRVNGVRLFERIHGKTDKEITDYLQTRINDMKSQDFGSLSSLTVHDTLNHYWEQHLSKVKSGIDSRGHLNALDRYLGSKVIYSSEIRGGRKMITCLTKDDIAEYKAKRCLETNKRGEPIAAATLKKDLDHLKAAINHEVDNYRVELNPITRFCSVSIPTAKKIVLDDGYEYGPDYTAILNAVRFQEDRERIEMLYETGMRPIELWKLRAGWVKQLSPTCWLIEYPHDEEKTETYKRIPLSDRAQEIVANRMVDDTDRLLFPSKLSRKEMVKAFIEPFRSAVRKTGLSQKGYTLYCTRRTRATIWDAIDGDAARYATGHTPSDVHSRHYVRITDDRLFKLVKKEYVPFQNPGKVVNASATAPDNVIEFKVTQKITPKKVRDFCVTFDAKKGNFGQKETRKDLHTTAI